MDLRVAGANRRMIVGLLLGIFGVAFQAFGVVTAMPKVADGLNGVWLYAWLFSTFVIGMVFSIITAGRITDQIGPGRPMVAGFALFTIGLVGGALAPNIYVMLAARLIQGLGGGAMSLALFVLVAQLFDERQRANLMSVLAFLWVLPAFVGPPIAAWITDRFGWRWVFWVVLAPILVAAVLSLGTLLRLPKAQAQAEPDPVPLWTGVAVAIAVIALQLAGQSRAWWTIPIAILGIALLIVAVPVIMPPGFLRVRSGLPAVMWTRMLQAGTFYGAEAFIPLMLVKMRGLDVFWAGLTLTIGSLGWSLGSWVQSRPWFRMRRDTMILLGAVLSLVGVGIIAIFAFDTSLPLALPATGWTISGFGMGLSMANTSLAVMGLSEVHRQGRNTSSLQVGEGMGNALAAGLAGTVFAAWGGDIPTPGSFAAVFATMVIVAIGAIWFSTRIGAIPNAVAAR